MTEFLLVGIFLLVVICAASLRIVPPTERVVVYRLGRIHGTRGPGLVTKMPFLDQFVSIPLGPQSIEIPAESQPGGGGYVVVYQVLDPERAVSEVHDYRDAMEKLAQTSIRSVLASRSASGILFEPSTSEMRSAIESGANGWGIAVMEVTRRAVPGSAEIGG